MAIRTGPCASAVLGKGMNSWWRWRCVVGAVELQAAAGGGSVKHIEGGEQRRCAMAFVVVGHRPSAALLHRQTGLGAVERLDLTLLINREDDGVGGRIDIETDDVPELLDKLRVLRP